MKAATYEKYSRLLCYPESIAFVALFGVGAEPKEAVLATPPPLAQATLPPRISRSRSRSCGTTSRGVSGHAWACSVSGKCPILEKLTFLCPN